MRRYGKNQRLATMSILAFLLLLAIGSTPAPKDQHVISTPIAPNVFNHVWAFYVGNYGTEVHDGAWNQWDYSENGLFKPPIKIPSPLFPKMGVYSSRDENIIKLHCMQMKEAGIDTVMLRWSLSPYEDKMLNETMDLLLNEASKVGLTVTAIIPNTDERTNSTVFDDIRHILSFSKHPAFHRLNNKPVLVVEEPISIGDFDETIESIKQEGIEMFWFATIISHFALARALEYGFDGIITNFGDRLQIKDLVINEGKPRGLIVGSTVLPGRNDTLFQSMRSYLMKKRLSGESYVNSWEEAMRSKGEIAVINSFNDFISGTNIEPVLDREDYPLNEESWSQNKDPYFYLELTKTQTKLFKAR